MIQNNMILSEGSIGKAYDFMKVLLKEKHVAFDNDYILIYLKTGGNIEFQDLYVVFLL